MITKLLKAFADYRAHRDTYNQLAGLSDHVLADLGIMRHEIKAIAYGALDVRSKRMNFDAASAKEICIADILPLNANAVLATNITQLNPLPKAA